MRRLSSSTCKLVRIILGSKQISARVNYCHLLGMYSVSELRSNVMLICSQVKTRNTYLGHSFQRGFLWWHQAARRWRWTSHSGLKGTLHVSQNRRRCFWLRSERCVLNCVAASCHRARSLYEKRFANKHGRHHHGRRLLGVGDQPRRRREMLS